MNNDVIEGRNPVLEALKSGRPVHKILIAQTIERHTVIAEIIHLAKEQGIPVENVPRQVLDRLGTTSTHQGVIARVAVKEYISLDDLLEITRKKDEPALYMVLDGIEDPQNLGSIIRTAEASGVHGIIIRERRAAGLTAAVERASAGAVEYMPVAQVVNISQAIRTMKEQNIWAVGIDRDGTTDYTRMDYKPATALVIGSEGAGLSDLVKKQCDFLVSIPMLGKITSLNASVAAALVMYEAARQRRAA